jgi:lipid A ethanolaminephosphotransferase
MLLWTSTAYARDFHLDTACLRGRQAEPLSHDNLFHSMLGLLNVETASHDKELDLFARCG